MVRTSYEQHTIPQGDQTLISENTHSPFGKWLQWTPLFFLVLAEFLVAVQAICVRSLEVVAVSPFELLQFRGISQIPGCILWLSVSRQSPRTWLGESRNACKLAVLQTGVYFCSTTLWFASLMFIPISEGAVISQTTSIWSAFFGLIFLGESWHLSEFCASCSCLLGVMFVARPSFLFQPGDIASVKVVPVDHLLGVVLVCLSSVLHGAGIVFVRASGTHVKVHWLTMMLYQGLGQTCLSWPCSILANESFRTLTTWESVLMLVFCCLGFVGQILGTIGQQREKSATGSLVRKGVSPLFAIIMQATLMPSDPLPWTTFVGFTIIFLGLSVVIADKAKREANDSRDDTSNLSDRDSTTLCPYTTISK